MEIKYIVEIEKAIIKDYLKNKGCSRTLLRKIRVNNCLYVNGELRKNHEMVSRGDEIIIKIEEKMNPDFLINKSDLDILYEDEYLLIVNKPNNLAIQPSRKHQFDNLISVAAAYFHEQNIDANIHVVNRLDYSTTGIVIIAKSGYMHFEMSKCNFEKKYLCIVKGIMEEKIGKICLPIKRVTEKNILRMVSPDGQEAITYYKVIKEYDDRTLLEVILGTGRTHQIRVHMSHLGHPLIGDVLYGEQADRLYLHCYNMKFIHPITKQEINIIKYPEWIKEQLCLI